MNQFEKCLFDRFKPDWEKAAEVPGDQLETKVVDLKERAEYQFRIVAINKAGPSPASEPTNMHMVKHRNCKQSLFHFKLNLIFFNIFLCCNIFFVK